MHKLGKYPADTTVSSRQLGRKWAFHNIDRRTHVSTRRGVFARGVGFFQSPGRRIAKRKMTASLVGPSDVASSAFDWLHARRFLCG